MKESTSFRFTHSSHEVVDVAVGAEIGQAHPHRLIRDRTAAVRVQSVELRCARAMA